VPLIAYTAFWTAGNASKIKQQTIDVYAAKYAKGELDAKVKTTAAV
jgi:fructose-bisphosphate aldolase class II